MRKTETNKKLWKLSKADFTIAEVTADKATTKKVKLNGLEVDRFNEFHGYYSSEGAAVANGMTILRKLKSDCLNRLEKIERWANNLQANQEEKYKL